MKIELEIDDIELFAKALNNAVIGYHEIVFSLSLGCDPTAPTLRLLENVSEEELRKRVAILNDIYCQVEDIERRMLNDQRRENYEES